MLKFFKDFLVYGFASVLSKVINIFLMPIYTSILSREEYGAMALLTSLTGMIGLISNLNIHSGIARDYYEKGIDRKILVSTGFWSILLLSLSIMTIMLFSRRFILINILNLNIKYEWCFILVLLSIPMSSLSSYFSILTRFKKKPILFSLGMTIEILLHLTISIFTIIYLKIGILGFFIAQIVSLSFSILFFSYINRSFLVFKYSRQYIKRALIYALPTLPAIIAVWLDASFGQILVGKYISLTDLGIYSIALQFTSVFTLIGIALNNVWGPFVFENYKKENFNQQVNKIYFIFVILITLVSIIISLFSHEIILLLAQPSYLKAGEYIALLCIPMGIYLLYTFASSGISISRDTKYIGISYVIGSICNILLLFMLLPIMGVIGVPIGLGLSRIITFSILYLVSKRKNLLVLPNRIILYFIISVFICYLLVNLDFLIRIFVFCVFSSIILYNINKKSLFKNFVEIFLNKRNINKKMS